MSCSGCGDSTCECSGRRGRRGATGPTGPTGSGGSGSGLLPFTGVVPIASEVSTYYMANPGGVVVFSQMATSPLNFPVPSARTFSSLAVRLDNLDTFEEDTLVVFTVLKNGNPTALTVSFTSTSDLVQVATADVSFAAGDLYDLQLTESGSFDTDVQVAASIGLGS